MIGRPVGVCELEARVGPDRHIALGGRIPETDDGVITARHDRKPAAGAAEDRALLGIGKARQGIAFEIPDDAVDALLHGGLDRAHELAGAV